MNHEHAHRRESGSRFPWKWVLIFIAFAAVTPYFLIAEQRAQLSGYLNYLPWLLLLACPLLHVFMHGGHRHGHSPPRAGADERKEE
jgi:hypothetical protein